MLWMIVIGLLIGIGTMMLTPERNPVGGIVAVAVAMAGSIVPAVLGPALGWYSTGEPAGIISSVLAAILLSCVYLVLLKRELQDTESPEERANH